MEEPSLKDTLKKIADNLEEMKEQQKVKEIHFWSKWKFWETLTRGKIKKNWINIIYIGDNKNITTVQAQIDENVILVNNIPHVVDAADIFLYKGKPTIIQPSWSLKPLSPQQNLKETKEAGNSTLGWEYIVNHQKKNMIKAVKNIGMIAWVIGGLALLGLGYYAIKSGMFH